MPQFTFTFICDDRFELSRRLHVAGALMDELGGFDIRPGKFKIRDGDGIHGNVVGHYEVV